MIVTEKVIKVDKLPFSMSLLCSSDMHIGHRHTDYDLITKELELCDRLNINGDMFDAISNTDRKRYRLSVPHDRILNARERQLDEALDWATEIYGPHASKIDVVGVGNHDDSTVKYNHFDLVLELVKRLNKLGGKINYGGYCGLIRYIFKMGKTKLGQYIIQYHHGSGHSSPVTKGMIDLNRSKTWIQNVDCFWKGHKHNKFCDEDQVMNSDGQLQPRVSFFSGSYIRNYNIQDQKSIMKEGRTANFADDNLMAPQGLGGWFIDINIGKDKIFEYEVKLRCTKS